MQQQRFIFKLYADREICSFFQPPLHCHISQSKIEKINFNICNTTSPYLVKDIPDYLEFKTKKDGNSLLIKTIEQYKGYLVDLRGADNAREYLNKQLSKRNRKNLYSKKRKLEEAHNISYEVFFGDISQPEYDGIFSEFFQMLKHRFQQKKIYNRYLVEWNELSASVYKKILRNEASLFVIKSEGKIIGITLNFHLNELILSHIQSYDIEYSHYNIGDILMLKNLEWCCDHQILVYDLSMGETEFKLKWCNHQYRFNHQIFYAQNSLWQRLIAFMTVIQYRTWQYLRKKGIIGGFIQFDKLLYLIRTRRQPE